MSIGWTEAILFALIGLIFLKPDELRAIARKLGRWIGDARRMSREFMDAIITEGEREELRGEMKAIEREIYTLEEPERVETLRRDYEAAATEPVPSEPASAKKEDAPEGSENPETEPPEATPHPDAVPRNPFAGS